MEGCKGALLFKRQAYELKKAKITGKCGLFAIELVYIYLPIPWVGMWSWEDQASPSESINLSVLESGYESRIFTELSFR